MTYRGLREREVSRVEPGYPAASVPAVANPRESLPQHVCCTTVGLGQTF